MHIGTGELIVVLVVALIIFGPSKLPALGKMAGKAVGTLRHYAEQQQLGRNCWRKRKRRKSPERSRRRSLRSRRRTSRRRSL